MAKQTTGEDLSGLVQNLVERAQMAARQMATLSTTIKNDALKRMAEALEAEEGALTAVNARDLARAQENGLSSAMIDRLRLTPKRIGDMARGLREIAALPDPIGEVTRMWRRPNGLEIGTMRVPLGVIAFIYESRPNVTADAAGLCLKSGNAVILRGGSEALHSNLALRELLAKAAAAAGVPEDALQMVPVTDRRVIFELLKQDKYVDLVVARGGEQFIRTVVEHSRIPVIKHDKGLCHTYVDAEADLSLAANVAFNAKVQRPSVCNAMETLLVHRAIAACFLPSFCERLRGAGVEVRGCPETCELVPWASAATEADWETEYLDLILSIKVVGSLDEALEHIARYGSRLSDSIITTNYHNARRFLREVDSAAVFINASTRLTDGNEFGFGAELGISTQKLHVRGPMGLESLTSLKYIIYGEGQVRT
ncbi:MAG TPA: glutamate-5-semialdehyde dehydrogenase [Alphaproteobacteria bacterium]|nr:glutamate-5-semialdehyde dehydrogenase [Alphaproteobacteria bacterium]